MDEADRIDSWKQIAAYLDKSERTVRRWQSLEGLPIHKHLHQERGSVWAYKSEIDQWLESRKANPTPLIEEPEPPRPQRRLHFLPYLAASIALVAVASALWLNRPPSPPRILETEVLTSLPGMAHSPAISPDGRKVAFYWTGPSQSEGGIYVKEVGAESTTQLVGSIHEGIPGFPYNPAWSPDGNTIAFLRRTDRRSPNAALGPETWLCLLSAQGGKERPLIRLAAGRVFRANNHHLSWSQDGKRILAPMSDGERRGIHWVPIAGGDPILLTGPTDAGDSAPTLAPGDRAFLFLRSLGPPKPVGVQLMLQELNSDGLTQGEPRKLYESNLMTSGLAWLPSGNEILYCRQDTSQGQPRSRLFRLLVNPAADPIPLGIDQCHTLSVRQPNPNESTRLVYGSEGNRKAGIWSGSPGSPDQLKRVAPSSRFDGMPAISPDGATLAFISTRSGRNEIWISAQDGTSPRKLTNDSHIASSLSWSADGTRILYGATLPPSLATQSSPPHRIFSVNVASGISTPIPLGELQACDPNWGANNEFYFWTRDELWQAALDGSSIRKLGKFPGRQIHTRIDGEYLYFARLAGPFSLLRVNLKTGREELLTSQAQFPSFGLSSRYLYFIDTDFSLAAIPIHGGPPRKLGQIKLQAGAQAMEGFSAAQDDSTIAFSLTEPVQIDLMLVRNFR